MEEIGKRFFGRGVVMLGLKFIHAHFNVLYHRNDFFLHCV